MTRTVVTTRTTTAKAVSNHRFISISSVTPSGCDFASENWLCAYISALLIQWTATCSSFNYALIIFGHFFFFLSFFPQNNFPFFVPREWHMIMTMARFHDYVGRFSLTFFVQNFQENYGYDCEEMRKNKVTS